jgi:hypothetical protein
MRGPDQPFPFAAAIRLSCGWLGSLGIISRNLEEEKESRRSPLDCHGGIGEVPVWKVAVRDGLLPFSARAGHQGNRRRAY